MRLKWSWVVLLAAVAGCATVGDVRQKAMDKVLAQAVFDLDCREDQLEIRELSEDMAFMGARNATFGVRGCGRRATYKTACGLGNCQMITDSLSASTNRR